MTSRLAGLAICLLLVVAGLSLGAGCDPCPSCSSKPTPTASLSGTVQGGLSPVSGAAVTLYGAGTAYGSNATRLGSATTDSNGNFTVG